MNRLLFLVEGDKSVRLDKFLHDKLKEYNYSREGVKELIAKGGVSLKSIKQKSNQVSLKSIIKPSTKLFKGDMVEVSLPDKECLLPVEGELKVIYEDDYLAVIDKPPNLVTHPAPSCREVTLVNLLLARYPKIKELSPDRPGIVHRLDKDTSGLMVIALKSNSQELLKDVFKKRNIRKKYLVLVHGTPSPEEGEIRLFMDRDHISKTKMRVYEGVGRESITRYKVLHNFSEYKVSLVEAEILTGRTHQIRVHFSHKGNPVLGDKIYSKGREVENRIINRLIKRQMLHAWKLEFCHPITKKHLEFTSFVPKDFSRVLFNLLKKRPMVVGVTGSVGSGKSKVCELMSMNKYPMWSADETVKKLYKRGNAGYEMIKRTFGISFVDEKNGMVDKARLFKAMASDVGFRHDVEQIIHPLVLKEMYEFIGHNRTKKMVILEVPLLIEAGWNGKDKDIFDVVVGVFCEESVRVKRLMNIRGWNIDQVINVDKWQLSQREKLSQCDLIIDNSYSMDNLRKKVKGCHKILREIRLKRLRVSASRFMEMGIIS